MKNFNLLILFTFFTFICTITNVHGQGEVTKSGSTWTATVSGSTVYSGSRMFDAVNAACNNAGTGATINIRNSGDSGEDGGDVYAIRPLANQTLNFNGHTVNCNSSGDLIVAVYADRKDGITVQNLVVTGNPRYGVWFRGCSDLTLTNTSMYLSDDSPVGLGIRVDASTASASNLTVNGTTTIDGSAGHGLETYGIDGISIGDVTATNTGGCGVLLNESINCTVGVVTGEYNCYGGGYATFRVANDNGATTVEGVYSRYSGRGFFSVSESHDCTINWVDIANTTSQGIFLEDATNTHVLSGTVVNGNPNVQLVRTTNCTVNVTTDDNTETPSCGTCSSGIVDGGTYAIIPRHEETMAMELYDFGSDNGTNVSQWTYWGGDYQHWVATDRGDGYWSFHPAVATEKAMDVWDNDTDDGANIAIYDYWGGAGQLWYFSNAGSGGWVRIKSQLSGKCLDVEGSSTTDGANLLQWTCTSGATNQMFRFEEVSSSSRKTASSSYEPDNQNADYSIFPNPCGHMLTIEKPVNTGTVTYRLIDMQGKDVTQNSFSQSTTTIETSLFTPGIYLLQLKGDGELIQRKIQIAH